MDGHFYITIDEGQFFKDLTLVRTWFLEYNFDVVVAALSADSDLQPFGHVHELMCIAYPVNKLYAFCHECLKHKENGRPKRKKAHHTFCTESKTGVVLVGASDKYLAVCLPCYQKLTYLRDNKLKEISSS